MASKTIYFSVLHDNDAVCVLHTGNTLCNDQLCRFRNLSQECLPDFRVGCGIDSTCTVIQNQHLWFLQQCSCDTEALFLAAGYVGSALLDVGVVALRHPVDKFIGAGKTADTLALFFRSIFITPSEVVVLAIGEDRLQSGEATSNANIRIPEIQQRLLERVSEVNENVVVVLFNGRPLDLRDVVSKAKAVLEVWMPGTEGANAIADVVFGAYAPSGKLTMSFPYSVGQVPVHYNEYSTGRPHVPGKDKDRFRSKYLDIPNAPLFPFGYGLGYTSFAISDVKLDKAELGMEDEIKASVTVKNTGDTKGTETVQLYIHDVAASVVRPVKELKDFCKVTLQPGEETEVIFKITEEELRFLTENERVESENGAFEVFIGSDSTTENKAEFVLKK